jgi:hypothetical protein
VAVFVHLLDPQGNLVAQNDAFDAVLDALAAGDIVVQVHTIRLPASLPEQTYRLQAGVYRRDTGQRLPLNIGSQDNLIWLQTWTPGG